MSHNVVPYWFAAKGANTSDTANFAFLFFYSHVLLFKITVYQLLFCVKHKFFIETNVWLDSFFFQKIFNIVYLNFMGANNDE